MNASHPTVAAVLVTHDAAPWLEATLSSIVAQRHQLGDGGLGCRRVARTGGAQRLGERRRP